MSAFYVVKSASSMYFFYREESGALMCRTLDAGRLSQELCLMRNIRRYFSMTFSNNEPLLFCQDAEGGLWLLTERSGQWNKRSIRLSADSGGEDIEAQRRHDVLITPMTSGKGLCMLYNTLSADGSGHYIIFRQTSDGGGWQQGSRIDKFVPFPHSFYEAQATSNEHMLLFYQTHANENTLGYREVTPGRFGTFQKIHGAAGAFSDTSFLTTSDTIHALYIVKTLFSCQLLYRHRTDSVFSTPVLLWEAPRIEQCLLSFVYDNLYATCMIGGQLYVAVSENRGESFTRMSLYKSKFCYEPAKAVFVSSLPMTENDLFIRQIYVDSHVPWDTQMIPDLYGTFYDFPSAEVREAEPAAPKDVLRDMQERLATTQRQLDERDRQLMQLMMKMKNPNPGDNSTTKPNT